MTYINWEYYSSLFTEVPDAAEFERLEKRAALKIDAITHLRVKRFEEAYQESEATDFQRMVHEQIRLTMCELVNTMHTQDISGMGSGIASVSNDGYSESYKITTAAEKEAQLYHVVQSGLSGTGLAGAL